MSIFSNIFLKLTSESKSDLCLSSKIGSYFPLSNEYEKRLFQNHHLIPFKGTNHWIVKCQIVSTDYESNL